MKKRSKSVILFVLILLLIIFIWVTRPIKIGIILPNDSSLGNEEYLFVRFYNEINNKIGFRSVELIVKDSKSNPEDIKKAFIDLYQEGISVIVGGVISDEAIVLSQLSETFDVPTFGITPSSSLLSNKMDNFYRFVSTNDDQALIVSKLYEEKGYENLLILSSINNTSYAEPMISIIHENYDKNIFELFYSENLDLEDYITKHRIDSIFCILDGTDFIKVVNQIRYTHPEIQLGSSSWGSSDILSLFSSDLFNKVWLFTKSEEVEDKEKEKIIKDFQEIYGIEASKGSHYALAVMDAIYDGILSVGDSRESLIKYFNSPREYKTIYGSAKLNIYGDSSLSLTKVLIIENGEIREINE